MLKLIKCSLPKTNEEGLTKKMEWAISIANSKYGAKYPEHPTNNNALLAETTSPLNSNNMAIEPSVSKR